MNGGPLAFNLDEDKMVIWPMLVLLVPATAGGFYLGRILFISPNLGGLKIVTKIFILVFLLVGVLAGG